MLWMTTSRVLAVEVGGRWNADSQALVRQLVRALRAPPALRAAASNAWTRRWWGMLPRLQCSTLLAARPWEHCGWSPKAPLGASLRWTTYWRSLSQLARAASRCAERGPCPSRWATPSSPDSAQPHVFKKQNKKHIGYKVQSNVFSDKQDSPLGNKPG